jgi:hypothetical protein
MNYRYWIPILLTLEHLEMGENVNNIMTILLNCMAKYGGILNE